MGFAGLAMGSLLTRDGFVRDVCRKVPPERSTKLCIQHNGSS